MTGVSGGIVGVLRTPTFYVESEQQRSLLNQFHKNEEHLAEEIHKNKTLCFSAQSFQKQHHEKERRGIRDADVTLGSPMILGVADGVSQVEDFGINASELPRELLRHCQDLGLAQLTPCTMGSLPQDQYRGPIPLLSEAFEATESLGSTTATLAMLDNSTKIHGSPHPMIAVITVGDCQLLVLRRTKGREARLESVFQTEMQRIDGHTQTPLQIARINEAIDPNFHDGLTKEVIERGSAVHCVSAYEGDIIVMGTDGVFDNLFCSEVTDICNKVLRPAKNNRHLDQGILKSLAQQIVAAAHSKTTRGAGGRLPDTPIGRGGKVDDTAVVVAEVVEWTEEHAKASKMAMARMPKRSGFGDWLRGLFFSCSGEECCESVQAEYIEEASDDEDGE
jgi:protein phosphatase PTC7